MLPADAGEHIAAKATARCTALGGKNKVTLTAAYRAFSASSYSAEKAMRSGTAVMVTGNTVVSNAVSYVVRLTAKDSLGKTTTFEKLIPTRSVTFSLREGGKGAAFQLRSDSGTRCSTTSTGMFSGRTSSTREDRFCRV